MENLSAKIMKTLNEKEGLTDREITNLLFDRTAAQQPVNSECRKLAAKGVIKRVPRNSDGLIGNYMGNKTELAVCTDSETQPKSFDAGTEDYVKAKIKAWLEQAGWNVEVRWGKKHGIDILAEKNKAKWIIEAKGIGSYQPMRVNFFLGALAELLQRMAEPNALYSIALPDHPQYRALWGRLPGLAKERTTISALFVSDSGSISQMT